MLNFRENLLIYKDTGGIQADPKALFNPKEGPSGWNAKAVNPSGAIDKFKHQEAEHAAKAWQHPFQDAYTEDKKDFIEIVKAPLSLPQAGLNILKSIATETSSAVGKVLSKTLVNPFKILGRTIAAPLAFIANNTKRLTDIAIKYPASAVNIAGSYFGRPALALSSAIKKGPERINSFGDRVQQKITSVSDGIRERVNKLNIPGMEVEMAHS